MSLKHDLIKLVILDALKKKYQTPNDIHHRIKEIVTISEASLFSLMSELSDDSLIENTNRGYCLTNMGSTVLEKEIKMLEIVYRYVRSGLNE